MRESLVTILEHRDEAQGMADDESSSFARMKVPELQNFLKARDIQIALDGKERKEAELLELCKTQPK